MSFLQLDRWLESHFVEVPKKIAAACGQLAGAEVLDVGCGEMLSDLGLVARGANVTGLDLVPNTGQLAGAYKRLVDAGYAPPSDYADRISYQCGSGLTLPFEDRSFDIVLSWGAFEHIGDPLAVLLEMKRVCRDSGVIYVNVFPWWHCFYGSHLSDFIAEPFFHLSRSPEWVRAELDKYIAAHPDEGPIIDHIYGQFLTLNRYSAQMFAETVEKAGLRVSMCELITYRRDLYGLPAGVSAIDAMVCGTEMVLRPA